VGSNRKTAQKAKSILIRRAKSNDEAIKKQGTNNSSNQDPEEKMEYVDDSDFSDDEVLDDDAEVEAITYNDEADWDEVHASMEVLKMSLRQKNNIFRTVASILHLGNIQIHSEKQKNQEDIAVIDESSDALKVTASQLGVEEKPLVKALTSRSFGGKGRGSVVSIEYRPYEAEQARDALAKAIYGRLFDHLIQIINQSIKVGEKNKEIAKAVASNIQSPVKSVTEKDDTTAIFGGADDGKRKTRNTGIGRIFNRRTGAARKKKQARKTQLKKNATLKKLKKQEENLTNYIGLLDIFGFESLENNSFEQLCINYCNEKLQYYFNEHIFSIEQMLYTEEGIEVNRIDYDDNAKLLQILEMRSTGLFSMLDDEINVAGGTDAGYLSKVYNNHINNNDTKYISKPPIKEKNAKVSFTVNHYAGKVTYNTSGFLDKNKDTLPVDILKLMQGSSYRFIAYLFGANASTSLSEFLANEPLPESKLKQRTAGSIIGSQVTERPASKRISRRATALLGVVGFGSTDQQPERRTSTKPEELKKFGFSEITENKKTLATQFKEQLNDLVITLDTLNPHFIKCIKPNKLSKSNLFEDTLAMRQLKYTGVLAVTKIRKTGFPINFTFKDFFHRYKSLHSYQPDATALVNALIANKMVNSDDIKIGKSRIFLNMTSKLELDLKREAAMVSIATVIQKYGRRFVQRKKYKGYLKLLDEFQTALFQRDEKMLDELLIQAGELPNFGRHIEQIEIARKLQAKLQEEHRIIDLLNLAITKKDISALQSGVQTAIEMRITVAGADEAVAKARKLIAKIVNQKDIRLELSDAVVQANLKNLTQVIARAQKMDAVDIDEYKQAVALKNRLEAEKGIDGEIEGAIKSDQLDKINAVVVKVTEMGLDHLDNAKKLKDARSTLRQKEQLLINLQVIIALKYHSELKSALKKCENAKIPNEYLKDAKELVKTLDKQGTAIRNVANTAARRDLKGLQYALTKATNLGITNDRSTVVREAVLLKKTLETREKIKQQISKASKAKDSVQLIKALSKASQMNISNSNEVEQGRLVLNKLLGKKKYDLMTKVFDAINNGDVDTLGVFLQRARKIFTDDDALEEAEIAMDDLEKENRVVAEIHEAMALGNISSLERSLEKTTKFGQFSERHRFTYEKAKNVFKATKFCEVAVEARDLALVNRAVASAKSAGAQEEGIIAECKTLKETLLYEEQVIKSLQEAMFTLDIHSNLSNVAIGALEKDNKISGSSANLMKSKYEDGNLASVKELHINENMKKLEKLLASVPESLKETNHDVLLDAQTRIERAHKIEDTLKLIESSINNQDLDNLNLAIEKVLELGIQGSEINQARLLRDKLETQRDKINKMMARINIVRLKMNSRNEIDNHDVDIVVEAIDEGLEDGLNPKIKQVVDCQNLVAKMKKQLVIQAELHAAYKTSQFAKLKLAMDHANESDIDIEIASKVRALVRNMDAKNRAQQLADFEKGVENTGNQLTEEELLEEREKKLNLAKNPRYNFQNYKKIRTDEDYAKGVYFNKKRIIADKLKHQTSIIPKSILQLDKVRSKMATKIHHSILGFCGDKSMSFLPPLAQDILKKALENPELIDEVYIQICKHVTKNNKEDSVIRAWQLMTLCCGSFPPSIDFEYYLINFINSYVGTNGLIGHYARYSFRRLEGIVNSGASGVIPTTKEIAEYKQRPPILATIELVDGTPLATDLPVTPDLNVGEIKKLCKMFLGLKEKRAAEEFGLFVVDLTEQRKAQAAIEAAKAFNDVQTAQRNLNLNIRTAQPLADDDYLGSVVLLMDRLKHEYSFVYKRKLFFAEDDLQSSDDVLYRRLIYLQAQEEFLNGDLRPAREEDNIKLSSICIATYEDPFPATIEELIDCDVLSYIPKQIRYQKSDREYAKMIISNSSAYANEPKDYLHDRFVDILKKQNKLYGACYFYCERIESQAPEVMRLPKRLIVGVNSYGVHILDREERNLLVTYHFNAINSWGGTSSLFSFSISRVEDEGHDIIYYGSQENLLDDSFAFDMASLGDSEKKLTRGKSSRKNVKKQGSENNRAKRTKSIRVKKKKKKGKHSQSYELALQMEQAADLSSLLNDYVKALVKREAV
jgi:myosin heavy subunit